MFKYIWNKIKEEWQDDSVKLDYAVVVVSLVTIVALIFSIF